jgi:hypothetical protein
VTTHSQTVHNQDQALLGKDYAVGVRLQRRLVA